MVVIQIFNFDLFDAAIASPDAKSNTAKLSAVHHGGIFKILAYTSLLYEINVKFEREKREDRETKISLFYTLKQFNKFGILLRHISK